MAWKFRYSQKTKKKKKTKLISFVLQVYLSATDLAMLISSGDYVLGVKYYVQSLSESQVKVIAKLLNLT